MKTLDEIVADSEKIGRFIFSEDHFNSSGRVYPAAFLPAKDGKASVYRGNCKTIDLRKIEDFEPFCQGRHCGPCPAAEIILRRVGEVAGWPNGSKGRFCEGL
jgi:hypothetical protein